MLSLETKKKFIKGLNVAGTIAGLISLLIACFGYNSSEPQATFYLVLGLYLSTVKLELTEGK